MTPFLMTCGHIESNPGPDHNTRSDAQADSREADLKDSILQDMRRVLEGSLREAMQEMTREMKEIQTKETETTRSENAKQSDRLERSVCEMKHSLSAQIDRVEASQQEAKRQMGALQAENIQLRKDINFLKSKCDYLENQSRRNNLLFFGIKQKDEETWADCEETVREIISEGMGIEEDVVIERAHRVGKGNGVVVKFLSFKHRDLVLRNARKLKQSDHFKDIFVREDLSASVRERRNRLKDKATSLYQAGCRPVFRFDKLVSDDGVFIFDEGRGEVVKLYDKKGRELDQRDRVQRVGADDMSGAVGGDKVRADSHKEYTGLGGSGSAGRLGESSITRSQTRTTLTQRPGDHGPNTSTLQGWVTQEKRGSKGQESGGGKGGQGPCSNTSMNSVQGDEGAGRGRGSKKGGNLVGKK